jgi:hypothetical protein
MDSVGGGRSIQNSYFSNLGSQFTVVTINDRNHSKMWVYFEDRIYRIY